MNKNVQLEYQIDYLNSSNFSVFSVHKLQLKVKAAGMLFEV